jgi:tetratricopeptide (TPR) repeat protein
MVTFRISPALPLAAVLLLGPEGDVRRGNAAYVEGDFEAALDHYAAAARTTTDPGRVAFNRAAALYQLGRHAEAADHYRQALEDAAGPRRVRALYGLANALAHQGHRRPGRDGLALLREAIRSYQACLALEGRLPPEEAAQCSGVWDDARANLQVVEPLLLRQPADPSPPPPSTRPEGPGPATSPDAAGPDGAGGEPGPDGRRPNPGAPSAVPPGATPEESREGQAGKGNLPPLLDDKDAPPLAPDQAAEHLRRQLDRIRRDRAQPPPAGGPASKSWRDW